MELAKELKTIRLEKKLSQWDFSISTGGLLKQSEISLFETGKIKLSNRKMEGLGSDRNFSLLLLNLRS